VNRVTKPKQEPAWIRHARTLYTLLDERAEFNEYGERVFEGKVLDVFHEVGASNADFSKIIRLLQVNGLIRYVQRGNRHQPTLIEITGELQPGALLPAEHLTAVVHAATLEADRLEQRVTALTAWRESLEKGGLNLAEVVRDYELRITRLEREVQQFGSSEKDTTSNRESK
jgi:hypothetical protein